MLVLSRKLGETIWIGDNISVKVVSLEGGRVKLAFSCPLEIPIHREEVRQRIENDQPADMRCMAV